MSEELRTLLMSVAVAVFAFAITAAAALVFTIVERKIMGRIQRRFGPWHVGPMGTLQSVADMVKLLFKEDLRPRRAVGIVHYVAPIVVVVPAIAIVSGIPLYRHWLVEALDFGVLFILAIPAVAVVGHLMAGWGSGNKYSMLGAARVVAQAISYELPLVLAAVAVALLAGTMNLVDIVEAQSTIWFALVMPVGLLIFLAAGIAELARAPFDVMIAESEIVGGAPLEYTGIRWAMFMMAEYGSMLVVSILTTILFLGGWQGPWLPGTVWLFIKATAVITFIIWGRGALPRLRIDQLMAFAWQVLLPLAFLNLIGAAVYVVFGGGATAVVGSVFAIAAFWFYRWRWQRYANPEPVEPVFRSRATI